jgi:hypothetical protein
LHIGNEDGFEDEDDDFLEHSNTPFFFKLLRYTVSTSHNDTNQTWKKVGSGDLEEHLPLQEV